jgi:hypothetical protein
VKLELELVYGIGVHCVGLVWDYESGIGLWSWMVELDSGTGFWNWNVLLKDETSHAC